MGKNNLENYAPITGTAKESFARYTLQKRMPSIIDGILSENQYSPNIVDNLRRIKNEIRYGKMNIPISTGPDPEQWKIWMTPFKKLSWFDAPFYAVEAYFYRLILDATEFFSNHIDPFFQLKRKDIDEHISQLGEIVSRLDNFKNELDQNERLLFILQLNLWGNKSDLSQLSLDRNFNDNPQQNHVIIDHSREVLEILSTACSSVAILLDNTGMELFTDLILARELVSRNMNVVLHAKVYPTFVSDATETDILFLLHRLAESNDERLVKFSHEILVYLEQGKIKIETTVFWNSPLHFYQMPSSVLERLERSDLIIVKGDANYRRVFGDRDIPGNANPKLLAGYLPARSIALRILKSEIILGLEPGIITHLDNHDQNWMINGKYGLIQVLN